MVYPTVQSGKGRKSSRQGSGASEPAASARKRTRVDGVTTRTLILEAARRRLCEGGYARLNVRDIAADAGVNHALIGYHFQGKRQLVMAVLDDANKRLLERQARMYKSEGTAGEKWRQACDFYDEDIASGFVRLMMELMAASFNDEALRSEFLPRLLAWNQVVEQAVGDFVKQYELELPVSVKAISAGICWFWIGMEASMTLGIPEEHGHQREALEAFSILLRRIEKPAKRRAVLRRA
jgi:AcrR family transcriptional regulator